MIERQRNPGSFKDPAGFLFYENGQLFRQINHCYAEDYNHLINAGLYAELVKRRWLVSHVEMDDFVLNDKEAYKIISPRLISEISYVYEWSFDMLKDAALLTIKINQLAIEYGMILKDANSFNIQFQDGSPVLIDTLSFEKYKQENPWVAYRQFCQHFLFPLYLIHYKGLEAQKWIQLYADGLPIDMVADLLPAKSLLHLDTLMHVFLQRKLSHGHSKKQNQHFSSVKMKNILVHLSTALEKLQYRPNSTNWTEYYSKSLINQEYLEIKDKFIREFLAQVPVGVAIDLGSNNGHYSCMLAQFGWRVIAVDSDAPAINELYNLTKREKIANILPLIIDLVNPSPSIGWDNKERVSFLHRFNPSLIVALALVHHLYFTHNIPLPLIFKWLHALTSEYLIIEFVGIDDPKVVQISLNKSSLLPAYSIDSFETTSQHFFTILDRQAVPHENRYLYLLKRKAGV